MRISKQQIEALEKIVKSGITKGFYLAGGTAITIKYNHRLSEDFDFFVKDKSYNFLALISSLKKIEVLELLENTLIFNAYNIKFSFFCYNYPLLKPPEFFPKYNINIASDIDIICMKSIAIIQRGVKKDFYDLWFLMKKNKISLNDIIDACKYKYKEKFNKNLLYKALIYFEDANRERYPEIDEQWDEIKDFFTNKVLAEFPFPEL